MRERMKRRTRMICSMVDTWCNAKLLKIQLKLLRASLACVNIPPGSSNYYNNASIHSTLLQEVQFE